MNFLNEMFEEIGNSCAAFWGNYPAVAVLLMVIFGVLILWMIIGGIVRKKKFKKMENEITLQRNLIIRAEEDINKLYTDLNAFSNHIVAFNNILSSQNIRLSNENAKQTNDQKVANNSINNPYAGYKTTEGQHSVKSKDGTEYTVDQIINTIVE